MSIAAVIQDARTPLAGLVAEELQRLGASVALIDQGRLAQEPVSINDERATLRGERLGCVAWLVDPSATYSESFESGDREFVDSETLALWAAILHLPGVRSTYRAGIVGLLEGRAWPTWRRTLAGRVSLAPLHFGGAASARGARATPFWLPYSRARLEPSASAAAMDLLGAAACFGASLRETMYVAGEPLDPHSSGDADAARELLAAGLVMALQVTDGDGRLVAIDPFPALLDEGHRKKAARRLADFLLGDNRSFGDNARHA